MQKIKTFWITSLNQITIANNRENENQLCYLNKYYEINIVKIITYIFNIGL